MGNYEVAVATLLFASSSPLDLLYELPDIIHLQDYLQKEFCNYKYNFFCFPFKI